MPEIPREAETQAAAPAWAIEFNSAMAEAWAPYLGRFGRGWHSLDEVLQRCGHAGIGPDRRHREAYRRLRPVRAACVQNYFEDAVLEWRRANPKSPFWMLPVLDELPDVLTLAPSARLVVTDEEKRIKTRHWRDRVQPAISSEGAEFPGSGMLRTSTNFAVAALSTEEARIYEKWFVASDLWHIWHSEERASLNRLADRPLPSPGLAWRQHRVRLDIDEVDLRTALPGVPFTVPYPMACRSIPRTIGGIARRLPNRDEVRRGHEDTVYLEIWAKTGVALPARPGSPQFEHEVLLPPGSRFKVVRHVDLPYLRGTDMPTTGFAHGVQVAQL